MNPAFAKTYMASFLILFNVVVYFSTCKTIISHTPLRPRNVYKFYNGIFETVVSPCMYKAWVIGHKNNEWGRIKRVGNDDKENDNDKIKNEIK